MKAALSKLKIIVICFTVFGLTNSSCGQKPEKVERKQLPSANATSHIFQLPLTTLRDTIAALFDFKVQYENPYLKPIFYYYFPEDDTEHVNLITFNAETAKDALFGKAYFQKPNTANDVYLHDFGTTWYSPVYHAKGKPFLFRTAYILKLKSISKDQTQVTVEAENPIIINGTTGMGPHGPIAREEKVEPTTVEEYALLLFIRDKLGDKTMTPLKMPAP